MIRLPLQVGTSAFWSLARCAALFLPSLAVLIVATPVIAVGAFIGAWELLKEAELKAAGAVLLIGAVLVLFILMFVVSAVKHLLLALRERASDVELEDGETLRIVGGRCHGRVFDLASAKCQIAHVTKTRMRLFDFKKTELLGSQNLDIAQLSIDGTVVAEAVRPIERESLAALIDTIHTQTRKKKGAEAGQALQPTVEVLRCGSCDAPAVPDDADNVACGYCSARVTVPGELREKLRAQRALEKDRPASARNLAKLLHQPTAHRTNSVMLALGLPILLVWPATAVLAVLLHKRGVLGVSIFLLLALMASAAILALFFLMRSTLVNRQALSVISTRFVAYAPRKPGDPHLCRSCRAPLASREGQMLVHCVYCQAENILGLDLRSEARTESKQARSLEAELARRRRERVLWAVLAVLSFAVLGSNRWFIPWAFTPHTERARCRSGDAAACLRYGHAREAAEKGDYGYDDAEAALDAFERGCKLQDDESCRQEARVVYTWKRWVGEAKSVPYLEAGCQAGDGRACGEAALIVEDKDKLHAVELDQRGCDLDHGAACSDLGARYSKGTGVAVDKDRALGLYQRACDRAFLLGCVNEALVLDQLKREPAKAVALIEKVGRSCAVDAGKCPVGVAEFYALRCQKDDQAACDQALDFYLPRTESPLSVERGLYDRLCPGNARACYGGGLVAKNDNDHKLALKLFTQSCDGGFGDGCNSLGVMYVKGRGGVTRDLPHALALYRKACELNAKFACKNQKDVEEMIAAGK